MKPAINAWWFRAAYVLFAVGLVVFVIDGWKFYTHARERFDTNEDYLRQSICTDAQARARHDKHSECDLRRIENETGPLVLAIQHVLDNRIFGGLLGQFIFAARFVIAVYTLLGARIVYDMYYQIRGVYVAKAQTLLPDYQLEKLKEN